MEKLFYLKRVYIGLYTLSLYWEVFGLGFGFLTGVYMGFYPIHARFIHVRTLLPHRSPFPTYLPSAPIGHTYLPIRPVLYQYNSFR